jgi:hypothetical protein
MHKFISNYLKGVTISTVVLPSGTIITDEATGKLYVHDGVTSGGIQLAGSALPSSTAPIIDGSATVGTLATYARADHIHPTDTSRSSTSVIASGSVTSRTLGDRFVTPFNVKDFGAIGNGSSNAASTKYGSLGALQAVYGTTIVGGMTGSAITVALTMELDWLATQAAINAATAAGGGTVYSPATNYVCSNSNSTTDGSGTLWFPPSDDFTLGESTNNMVNWIGDGFNATNYKWPSDLGSGKFAVNGARVSGNPNNCAGLWQDIGLVGPNASVALGIVPANMSGWGWNSRREMVRLRAWGFNAGFDIVGDQTTFEGLHARNCYYGMYFNAPSSTNFGDLCINKSIFEFCTQAGIGVNNGANIGGSRLNHVGVYTSPFGIFKETGGADNSIIQDCVLTACQFEALGNGMIADAGNLSGATRVGTLSGVWFYETHFSYNATYTLTSGAGPGAYNGVVDCLTWTDVHFEGMRSTWFPGANGMFSVTNLNSVSFRGPLTALCAAAAAHFPNTFFLNIGAFSNVSWEEPGNCRGIFAQANTTGISAGNVLVYAGAGAVSGAPILAQLSTGANTDVVLGVALATTPHFGAVPIVQYSQNGVKCLANTTAITDGHYVRTAASGFAVAATSRFDTTSPVIGYAAAPLPNATSTTSFSLISQGLGS